ncbi:MAG: hypothetical protein AAFO85_00985 [Cyanobacteria bacterium J06598_4]
MAFTEILITRALTKIANDPQAIGRVLDSLNSSMLNIETKTMGEGIFWHTISDINGWRLQENKVFGNCRILDPQNNRKAWGGKRAILKAFEKL